MSIESRRPWSTPKASRTPRRRAVPGPQSRPIRRPAGCSTATPKPSCTRACRAPACRPSPRRRASGSRTRPGAATWISMATASTTSATGTRASRRRSRRNSTTCPSRRAASPASLPSNWPRRSGASRRAISTRCCSRPAARTRWKSHLSWRGPRRAASRPYRSGMPSTAPVSARRASAERPPSVRASRGHCCPARSMWRRGRACIALTVTTRSRRPGAPAPT